MLAAQVSTLPALYLTYGLLGGVGTGIVYVGVIGHMVQWFPDKRGLATGLVAAGYGVGALLTTFPIAAVLRESSYQTALTRFGFIFAGAGVLAAQGLRHRTPPLTWNGIGRGVAGAAAITRTSRPRRCSRRRSSADVRMMTMMSTTVLMVTSQMGAFTRDFGMAGVLVYGLPVLPLALSIDRVTNGATRPLFGWISDRFGRENTMLVAFGLEGTAMALWLLTRHNPVLFVRLSGLVFFDWGEIFAVPVACFSPFGTTHATANYGCLYIAQGVGSVLGGTVAALLHESTGSWIPVFAVIIAMDFTTAALAITVLKPMRRRWLEQSGRARVETAVLRTMSRPASAGRAVRLKATLSMHTAPDFSLRSPQVRSSSRGRRNTGVVPGLSDSACRRLPRTPPAPWPSGRGRSAACWGSVASSGEWSRGCSRSSFPV